jgi:hypothetical protein
LANALLKIFAVAIGDQLYYGYFTFPFRSILQEPLIFASGVFSQDHNFTQLVAAFGFQPKDYFSPSNA